MQHLRYEKDGAVAILALARGKANAMNLEMVREMAWAFQDAEQTADAIVWASDRPRFFSGGFDVTEVFGYSREELSEFLTVYSGLQQAVLHSPKPTVAALPGQTYAGGAILALSCDFRIMAEGPYGFALTEVNIGVNLPASIFHLLAAAVGGAHARRMFLTGEPLTGGALVSTGLVQELVPEAEVVPRAVELARKLAAKPKETYAAIKRTILAEMGLGRSSELVADVEAWFTPEAQAFKRKLAESMKR